MPFETPPTNPALGFIWRPPVSKAKKATSTSEQLPTVRGMAEGVIRVEKKCSQCHGEYEAWMFLARWRGIFKSLPVPERQYFVGSGGWCDPCVDGWQRAADRVRLEGLLDKATSDWNGATTSRQAMYPARKLKNILGKLLGMVEFGGEKFMGYTGLLDKVTVWITENQTNRAA